MDKSSLILVVVAVLGASFYAGKKSAGTVKFGATVKFEHAEVINNAATCSEGSYIGKCLSCDTCDLNQYDAGGCSFFKNTFCTLCAEITHCPHENVRCETGSDEKCSKCDDGYWGDDCKECTVCSDIRGVFEAEMCTQQADAVCGECAICDAKTEFTSKICTATSDSECDTCATCDYGQWQSAECETIEKKDAADRVLDTVYELGEDAKCTECDNCVPDDGKPMFTSGVCKTGYNQNTECSKCACGDENDEKCVEGTYMHASCAQGMWSKLGQDAVFADCTPPEEDEWTVFPCSPLNTQDAEHQKCSQCVAGEFEEKACEATSDTVCPQCPTSEDTLYIGDANFKSGLQNCKSGGIRCAAPSDDEPQSSKCGEWDSNNADCRSTHSGGSCNWESNCEAGFSGESCCYHKHPQSCFEPTRAPYKTRLGKNHGYTGTSTEDFVEYCRVLCDENPECMAFEVEDGGDHAKPSGSNNLGEDSTCYFMGAYTQDTERQYYKQTYPSRDCYSNTCRQNSYSETDGKKSKTINYKVG